MKETSCPYAFDHVPGETCEHCKLEVDQYGNTEADFLKCSFPNCGCDGARLCMAGEANDNARECNVQGMYTGKDAKSLQARMALLYLCMQSTTNNT